MRVVLISLGLLTALSACSTATRPLLPGQGPASYVCYSSTATTPDKVRAAAVEQCQGWGLEVTGLIEQSWSPLRCGLLTPTLAAFQCGRR